MVVARLATFVCLLATANLALAMQIPHKFAQQRVWKKAQLMAKGDGDNTYDETLARYLIWPMASAAYSSKPQNCVEQNFQQSEFRRQVTVSCDPLIIDACSAFIAVSHTDRAIIISFRGSTNGIQVGDEVYEAVFKRPIPFAGGGAVGEYYYHGFFKIWDEKGLMKDDFMYLKNKYAEYDVWITGHSLGAAIAAVAAATISQLGLVEKEKIKLVTFGEPRVGDKEFAEVFDTLVPYAYRVIHSHDVVAHLPPKDWFKFHHHKNEVWYQNNMSVGTNYTICEEEEGNLCSDSQLDLDFNDHLHYFNLPSGFAYEGCSGYNPNGKPVSK